MGHARDVVDRATQALLANDLEKLREVYAEDVTITTPDSGTFRGVDKFIDWNRAFTEAFSDLRWEETAVHEVGDYVISQGELVAEHTAPFEYTEGQTIPATGKQVRFREIDVAKVENGMIVQHDLYFDQLDLLVQLGVIEAPTAITT